MLIEMSPDWYIGIPTWLEGIVTKDLGRDQYRIDDELKLHVIQWRDTKEVVALWISCARNITNHYCEAKQMSSDRWVFEGMSPSAYSTDSLRQYGRAQVLMADIVERYEEFKKGR